MPDQPHSVLKPVPGDQRDELLAVSFLARRVAGEDDRGAVERAFTGERCRGFDGFAGGP